MEQFIKEVKDVCSRPLAEAIEAAFKTLTESSIHTATAYHVNAILKKVVSKIKSEYSSPGSLSALRSKNPMIVHIPAR